MKKQLLPVLALVLTPLIWAGSLNPSKRPAAGTMKPLDQVEPRTPIASLPFTVSQGGSYYLTQNLTCAGTAITVTADNVSIDLCGFTLTGTGTSGVGIDLSMRNNVEIRNGTITRFPQAGILDFSPNAGDGHRVIGVRLIANGTYGIALGGRGQTVRDCSVQGTLEGFDTTYGINVGAASIVSGCSVIEIGTSSSQNTIGIFAYSGCTVSKCTVHSIGEGASGQVRGVELVLGGNVSDCCIYANGRNSTGSYVFGIKAGTAVTVLGNTVYGNGLSASGIKYGIFIWSYGLVDRNTSYDNGSNLVCPSSAVQGANCAP